MWGLFCPRALENSTRPRVSRGPTHGTPRAISRQCGLGCLTEAFILRLQKWHPASMAKTVEGLRMYVSGNPVSSTEKR